jgi:hypothetical protein
MEMPIRNLLKDRRDIETVRAEFRAAAAIERTGGKECELLSL